MLLENIKFNKYWLLIGSRSHFPKAKYIFHPKTKNTALWLVKETTHHPRIQLFAFWVTEGQTPHVVICSNQPRWLVLDAYSANQNTGFYAVQKIKKSRLVPWWEKCDLDPIKRCRILRMLLWESAYFQLHFDVNIIWAQNKKFCTMSKRKEGKEILFLNIFFSLKFTYLPWIFLKMNPCIWKYDIYTFKKFNN